MSDYADYLRKIDDEAEQETTKAQEMLAVSQAIRVNISSEIGAPDRAVTVAPFSESGYEFIRTTPMTTTVELKAKVRFKPDEPEYEAPFKIHHSGGNSVLVNVGDNMNTVQLPVHSSDTSARNAAKLLWITMRAELDKRFP